MSTNGDWDSDTRFGIIFLPLFIGALAFLVHSVLEGRIGIAMAVGLGVASFFVATWVGLALAWLWELAAKKRKQRQQFGRTLPGQVDTAKSPSKEGVDQLQLNKVVDNQGKKKNAKTAEQWFNLGSKAKEPEKKVEYYTKGLEIDPKDADAWNEKGDALYDLKKYEDAIHCYNKAREIKPQPSHVWLRKAFALEKLDRYEDAIHCYDKMIEIDPKHPFASQNKGNALEKLDRYEDAIHCYDTILQIKPKRADVWLRKAFALEKLGKYQDAIDSFDKLLKIDAKCGWTWKGKGDALCELGKHEEAINCYDKALQARPGSITGRGFFKRITLRKQDEDDAWFLKFWLSNIWCKKAQALAKLGTYEDAIDCYDKAIEIDQDAGSAQWEKEDIEKQIKILAVSSKVEQLQDKYVIPQSIHAQIKLFEEGDHEIDIESLERLLDQVENTTPELELMLKHEHLTVNRWDQLELEIRNTSIAHAFNVIPTFSDEIEMRRIKAVTVKGQESITLELGAKAKIGGRIPVDIKLQFEDGKGNKNEKIYEVWIEVTQDAKAGISPEEDRRPAEFIARPESALPPGLAENYHDIQLIGQGGFAKVFKAVTVRDNKEVAIKIPVSLDQATGKTFMEEIKNWTRLNHPNIVEIYHYNILPIPFFEMELCDSSLDEYIKDNKDKRIQLNNACWIVFNAAEGLKPAHSLNIIHRDLKPQNILLKDGMPKIADWGLSKVMGESPSLSKGGFTPHYAAPEQIIGKQKDERTDIWQLGVIFYQITTGKLPFEGEDVTEIRMSILAKEPVRPSELNPEIDPELEKIILKPISKDPEGRYQSIREFQMALATYLQISIKEELSKSVSAKDSSRSADYCAQLLMVYLKINDGVNAYKYVDDLINYARGDLKDELIALKDGIERRVNQKDPIPTEIVNQADILVHKVKIGRS